MSITDELREAINELRVECEEKEGCGVLWYTEPTRDRFSAIADRIDAKHEECAGFCRRLEDAASKGEEATLFGTDYVPLPKDADGETIRVGDRIEYNTGGRDTVRFLTLNHDGWMVNERGWKAETMHHVKPDSWERIIRDAQGDGILNQIDGRPSDFDALVERCKRLAGEDA